MVFLALVFGLASSLATAQVSEDLCVAHVHTIPQVLKVEETKDELKLTVDTNQVYSEEAIAKWARRFVDTLFAHEACHGKQFSFVVSVDESSYFQGRFIFSDTQLLRENKITLAEWVRRLEIAQLETVSSLRKNLIKARASADHARAFELVEKLSELEPENFSLRLIKANILLSQGLSPEAAFHFEYVLKERPQEKIALFNLAHTYKKLGRFSDAVAVYENLLTLERNDQIYLNLADAHLQNNNPMAAQAVLDRVGEKDQLYFLLLANLQRLKGDAAAARSTLEQIAAPKELASIFYYNLTVLNIDLKDVEAARMSFAKLQQTDPKLAKELEFLPFLTAPPQTEGQPVSFLFGFFGVPLVAAGPAEPSEEIKSANTEKGEIDVPYKPVDIDEVMKPAQTEGIVPETEGEQKQGDDLFPEANKNDIAWENIPYLPSKYPDFKPEGDPRLE